MGLDVVEIVLRVEESFGVDLPDDELESAATVGDLYRLLLRKLDGGYDCLSSRTFYRVRRSMVNVLGVPRRTVRPGTELARLLPTGNRRSAWRRIAAEAGLRFPPLEFPRWFDWSAFTLSVATMLVFSFCVVRLFGGFQAVSLIAGVLPALLAFLVGCAGVVAMMAALRAAFPFIGSLLPVATTSELVRAVLARNLLQIREGARKTAKANEDEVWRILREIIVDQLQVREEEVVMEARFGEDLGAD